jgi:ATP-binding cassette, subfamily B, bacterial
VISKSLKSLLRRAGGLGQLAGVSIVGSSVALLVPLIAYLLGTILNCLLFSDPAVTQRVPLSPWMPDIEAFLPSMAPLAKVSTLLTVVLGLLVLAALLLYVFNRQTQHAAVTFEVSLIRELRAHAKRLAITRTLSAQETALTDCLDYHLPRVRAGLSRWWWTFPSQGVQLLGCLVVAMLLAPELTLLTLLATLLVVLSYRYFDRSRRTMLPVVRERAAQERSALVRLSLKGPLLESVHNQSAIEARFAEQLTRYESDAVRSLTSSAWKIPTLVLVSGLLACLFLFVVSVKVLASDTGFTIASAFPFALCLAGASVSMVRLERSVREMNMLHTATEELNRFLSLSTNEIHDKDLKTMDALKEHAELEHVTVQDSSGRKLLEDVSVTFKPGQLIGVVSSQRLQAHALVELLMGFGRPVSGRMLVDGQLVSDFKPQSLIDCAHWVASDGAIVTGTVSENILGAKKSLDGRNLGEILQRASLTETVQKLPDEQMTLITLSDDRLTTDDTFRIGVARAACSQASVVVVEEPDVRVDQSIEQASLNAIRSLVGPDKITVVIPQRLLTLRQCDLVVMVHDHRVVDTGTHADLLQRNELYRHLNYLRFNAFRGLT